MSKNSESWAKIYDDLGIATHDFSNAPFPINAEQIKRCTKDFNKTSQKEVRVICKQDSREDRPQIFIDNELFILPTKNGEYIICKGVMSIFRPLLHNRKITQANLILS